jgi:hypothetical protein
MQKMKNDFMLIRAAKFTDAEWTSRGLSGMALR